MKNPTYLLIDAVAYQKKAPSSFELPPAYHRSTVKPGELVKLIFVFPIEGQKEVFERMWVKVIEGDGDIYKGILKNEPSQRGFIEKGNALYFSENHIININPPRIYFEDKLTLG